MWHLKRVKSVVCSPKFCCSSTSHFFPFLCYQSIVILISVSSTFLLYLSPDLHGPCLPFSGKFTSVKLLRWMRWARFSHYLVGNSLAEVSLSEMCGFCCWPPPHGYPPRHNYNLTFWCTAFSLCTPARWWCVLALKASTKQWSLLVVILEQEQSRPRSQAFTLCLEFLRYFSASHTSQL